MVDENNLEVVAENNSEVIPDIVFKEITTPNGLFCQFEEGEGVIFLDVKSPFTADDFSAIEDIINPYFSTKGELKGIIINSKKFPYWSSSENRKEYMNFAIENHHKFKRAALSMGGFFTRIVARIGRGRVHPEIKVFSYNDVEKAQEWVLK